MRVISDRMMTDQLRSSEEPNEPGHSLNNAEAQIFKRSWTSERHAAFVMRVARPDIGQEILNVQVVLSLCTFHIFRSDLVSAMKMTFHSRFSSPEPISLTMETQRCCCTAKFTRLHSSGRPDTKGTLWASRAQTRQRKTKDRTKLQVIAAVATTVFQWVIRLLLLTERKNLPSYDRSRQRQSRNQQCKCIWESCHQKTKDSSCVPSGSGREFGSTGTPLPMTGLQPLRGAGRNSLSAPHKALKLVLLRESPSVVWPRTQRYSTAYKNVKSQVRRVFQR